jgi:flagellar hook-basal body complex protein FliE
MQTRADRLTEKLAAGEVRDIHQVMIAVEQVNIALQLTMQVRNKVIESYQEIMRMQV